MVGIVNPIFDLYIAKLSELGYDAKYFNPNHLLIVDYELPAGWNESITDLLLLIPNDLTNGIHGIQIPSNLTYDTDKKLFSRIIPGHYVNGWTLLSFVLDSSLCNDNVLRNHMIMVNRVLSFKDHKK